MSDSKDTTKLEDALDAVCRQHLGGPMRALARLAGGANCEMWAFRVRRKAYVLRKGVRAAFQTADGAGAVRARGPAQGAELAAGPSVALPQSCARSAAGRARGAYLR